MKDEETESASQGLMEVAGTNSLGQLSFELVEEIIGQASQQTMEELNHLEDY
jgi:hypothetical protein